MNRQDAISARWRETFIHVSLKNADGTPLRARVNGACKTWVTRPGDFRLPMKHGLRQCFYINQDNAGDWTYPVRLAIGAPRSKAPRPPSQRANLAAAWAVYEAGNGTNFQTI